MKYIFILGFFLISILLKAQNNLLINPNILLPKDSIQSKLLINSLNNFLIAAQKPNETNYLIFENEKVETFILLDEFKNIEKNIKLKDDNFFKPYLTNILPLLDSNYLISVSYIGIHKDTAMLRASFEFIAHKDLNSYTFSSPLIRNTKNWKTAKLGNNIFHYQNSINEKKLKEFHKLTTLYDKKLKVTDKVIELYCTDNIVELQKLVGVLYKGDYNGRKSSVWSSMFGDKKVIVLGNQNASFNDFDAHDLFHDRLSLKIQRKLVNKPVDEGCAYLYGGSWGLSWKEIFSEFKKQIANNKSTNWIEIKENPVNFKTKEFENSADFIVNALLVQRIEKSHGFEGVWELLNVGPFEKGNEKYYQVLEKLTGITKATYNAEVWELINGEK